MISTDPKCYTINRTSACQGEHNPHGFGWQIDYANGDDKMEIILPDNVIKEFIGPILDSLRFAEWFIK